MKAIVEGAEVVFRPEAGEPGKEHKITIPQSCREALATYFAMKNAGLTDAQIPTVLEILKLMKG